MCSTTFLEGSATRTWGGHPATRCSDELLGRYRGILEEQRLSWTEHHRLIRLLGSGGQGVVYLSERRGTDSFTLPVALKIFSPERYEDERSYDEAMGRMAQVAARVAQIQQDNLLDVHNWVDRSRIRMMEMEWVDGYDLARLLTRKMLERLETAREQQALELHQPGDRHGRADAAAGEAGHRHRHRPRLPGGPGRAAPRGHRPRRPEAVEHHAQADRQREDRRPRLGLRLGASAGAADLHAHLRRARGARRRRVHAAQRPGQPGLRADRDALRRAAVRRADELPRPVGGQAVPGPAAAAHPARAKSCATSC